MSIPDFNIFWKSVVANESDREMQFSGRREAGQRLVDGLLDPILPILLMRLLLSMERLCLSLLIVRRTKGVDSLIDVE